MLDEKELFGEETRVAAVDPATGIDLDGTRITRGGIASPIDRRPTAQFLPTTGMRETGEITSMWTASPPIKARAISRLRSVLDRVVPSRSKRLVALAVAATIAVAIVATLTGRGSPSRDVDRIVDTDPGGDGLERQVPPVEPMPTGTYSASLGEAVSALLDGHMEESLGHYEALLLKEPADESLEQAVRILRRRIGGEGR